MDEAPTWKVSAKQRSRARRLRHDLTNAERIIWHNLRAHRLKGAAFRRQAPIRPYVADFVCHGAALIVEIDGGQHFEARHEEYDRRRDAFLRSKGFRVLRFNNYEVMQNRDGVLQIIAAAITDAPSPPLPRKRGREQTIRSASTAK